MRPRLHNALLRLAPLPRWPAVIIVILALHARAPIVAREILAEAIAVELEAIGFGALALGVFGGADAERGGGDVGGAGAAGWGWLGVFFDGAIGVFAVYAFAAAYGAFEAGVVADAVLFEASV